MRGEGSTVTMGERRQVVRNDEGRSGQGEEGMPVP